MALRQSPRSIVESDLRLRNVLARRREKEGSYLALEKAIEKAAGGNRPVDRRKLKAIVEGSPNLVLSLKELRALDRYLDPFGEGLASAPLFARPDILQGLANSGDIVFLLGSRPDAKNQRIQLSHWDVLAMSEVQRGVYSLSRGVRFDIREARLPEASDDVAPLARAGDWMDLLGDQGPSLVCLGSSRANPAAETVLSRMFGSDLADSSGSQHDPNRAFPFRFVWPDPLRKRFGSRLHLGPEEAESIDPDGAAPLSKKNAAALVADEKVYTDQVSYQGRGDIYGVCAAQRRHDGRTWLVLAGVTGSATFAAAAALRSLDTGLRSAEPGRNSPVYWSVIKGSARKERGRSNRKGSAWNPPVVVDQGVASGPHVWEAPA